MVVLAAGGDSRWVEPVGLVSMEELPITLGGALWHWEAPPPLCCIMRSSLASCFFLALSFFRSLRRMAADLLSSWPPGGEVFSPISLAPVGSDPGFFPPTSAARPVRGGDEEDLAAILPREALGLGAGA